MRYLPLLLLCWAGQAFADKPWVFEAELLAMLPAYEDRLLTPSCTKVVPVEYVDWYARDPRPGWEISCGNKQPMYMHWLGRRVGRPLPNLVLEVGWRHFSSPADAHELSFDAVGIRGRFEFGGKARR
jgi:hypothetical protein